jgi:hypothetical protein
VTRRIRAALLLSMFAPLVSGRKKRHITKANPETHISSQIDHFQPFDCTAKPPTSGPSVGPQTATAAHMPIAYVLTFASHMSLSEAPPVPMAGDPMNPVKNRKAKNMPRFLAYMTPN